MRRAVAKLPVAGIGLLGLLFTCSAACNALTGVSDLAVDAVEAGVKTEPPVDASVVVPPRDARAPDTGTDASVDAAEASIPSTVTMTIGSSPGSVNLTTEGLTDWMEWGEDSTVVPSHKVGGAGIDDFVILGTNPQLTTLSDNSYSPAEFWSDGTPHGTDNGNHGAAFAFINDGDINAHDLTLKFGAKSAPTMRTFVLYVSAVRVKATIEATFGAGRAAAAPMIIDAPAGNPQYKRIVFAFSSGDSAKLEVRYAMMQRYDNGLGNSRLGFHCASLF